MTLRPANPNTAFLLCLSLLCARPVCAVAPAHLWSEGFGAGGSDIAYSAAADHNGNVYVTGAFEGQVSFGAATLTSEGNRDMFLVKLDADGAVVWAVSQGGTGNEYGLGVAEAQDGNNVYVTGTHNTMPGLTSAGANDIYVAGFQAVNGIRTMIKGFGSTMGDAGQSIATTASNGLLLTGYFTGSVNFGGGVLTSAGLTTSDIFVVALTSAGAHLWSRRAGGSSTDIGREIVQDTNGNVFVTGEFRDTADFGGGNLVSAGDADVFLVKYDNVGNMLLSRRFGGVSADVGNSVASDGSGGVFLTGAFGGTIDFGGASLVSAGASDIFLARLDTAGTHQWSARFGGSGSDAGNTVANRSGSVVVAGSMQSAVDFGGGSVDAPGLTDAFVAGFGADGAHQWSRGMGGASDDIAHAVAINAVGAPCVAGQFRSSANFGGSALSSAGDTDMFTALYDPGLATAVSVGPEFRALSISNYPNPFNPATTVRYTLPVRGVVTLSIHDAAGAVVATLVDHAWRGPGVYTAPWNGRTAHGMAVASGIYFARIELAGAVRASKMILLK